MSVFIAGRTGRLGREFSRLAEQMGVVCTEHLERAAVVVVAQPRSVAMAAIEAAGGRTVIDLSGVLKTSNTGRYALLVEGDVLWDGAPPRAGDRLANPGCIASSVILGLRQSGVLETLSGGLHITSVGGRSMAARGQEGGVRIARRLGRSHPHCLEIEQACVVEVTSFAPMVAYGQERGVVSVISGCWKEPPAIAPARGAQAALDVEQVVGTPEFVFQLTDSGRGGFTLVTALDNLTFPAMNAVRLAALVSDLTLSMS